MLLDDCLNNLNKEGFHCFNKFINEKEQSKLESIVTNFIYKNKNKSFFLMDEGLNNTL